MTAYSRLLVSSSRVANANDKLHLTKHLETRYVLRGTLRSSLKEDGWRTSETRWSNTGQRRCSPREEKGVRSSRIALVSITNLALATNAWPCVAAGVVLNLSMRDQFALYGTGSQMFIKHYLCGYSKVWRSYKQKRRKMFCYT